MIWRRALRNRRQPEIPSLADDFDGKNEQIDDILAAADCLVREMRAEVAQASARLRGTRAEGQHGSK